MLQIGQTVGNYKISAKLGEGGMGVVYLAEHPVIGKKVALKAIHPQLSRNPEVTSRFMVEARSVNQIGNEHIVDISDFGTTPDGEFYFIMEFLQGEALADTLKREQTLEPNRALHIAAQVAEALAASHGHGIIHRDLKPENIFLIHRGTSNDFVKVLDFGLAKLTQGEEKVSHKTRTGSVMGTPFYMAPEQCEGRESIDHRADVYSLGVILFEMLTGKVPFGGEGYGEIIVKHITMDPPRPRAINPMLTAAHEALLFRALSKKREGRFGNMEEFRLAMLDVEKYLASMPPMPFSSTPTPVMIDNRVGHYTRGSTANLGANAMPMPSTFRDGAGELDIPATTSRKGLLVGLVAAVAMVAGIAVFMTGNKSATETKPPEVQTQPTVAAPVAYPLPKNVAIMFTSRPEGAKLIRKDNGHHLGTTPVEVEQPYGKKPIEFLLRKDGFEEQTATVVPESATQISVNLAPIHKVTKSVTPPSHHASGTKPASVPKSKPHPPGKKSSKSIDDDGVLEPSFK